MSIGAVLDEAWTLFTRFFFRFFLIALVVFAAINLVYALVGSTVAQAVVAPFSAIAVAMTYFRLREAHAATAVPVEA